MSTYEPRFCEATTGCHDHQVRCYLTHGQHRDGHHTGFCARRDGVGELHVHYPQWPVMAEQTRAGCGES